MIRKMLKDSYTSLIDSKLVPDITTGVNSIDLDTMDLQKLSDSFLDAVELVPIEKEQFIPKVVIQLYNDIVDGIVKLDGHTRPEVGSGAVPEPVVPEPVVPEPVVPEPVVEAVPEPVMEAVPPIQPPPIQPPPIQPPPIQPPPVVEAVPPVVEAPPAEKVIATHVATEESLVDAAQEQVAKELGYTEVPEPDTTPAKTTKKKKSTKKSTNVFGRKHSSRYGFIDDQLLEGITMEDLQKLLVTKFSLDESKVVATIKGHIKNVTGKRNEADLIDTDGVLQFVPKEAV